MRRIARRRNRVTLSASVSALIAMACEPGFVGQPLENLSVGGWPTTLTSGGTNANGGTTAATGATSGTGETTYSSGGTTGGTSSTGGTTYSSGGTTGGTSSTGGTTYSSGGTTQATGGVSSTVATMQSVGGTIDRTSTGGAKQFVSEATGGSAMTIPIGSGGSSLSSSGGSSTLGTGSGGVSKTSPVGDGGTRGVPESSWGGTGGVVLGQSTGGTLGLGGTTSDGRGSGGSNPIANATGGTGGTFGGSHGIGEGGTAPSQTWTGIGSGFTSCTNLGPRDADALQRICYDFSNPNDGADFVSDEGTWLVSNGEYLGIPKDTITCGAAVVYSGVSAVRNITATDVRVHVRIASMFRPDKYIVLRDRGAGNRILLGFRANFPQGTQEDGGDLVIQEEVQCGSTFRLSPRLVLIPHAMGEAIDVDVELKGISFRVFVNSALVLNGSFPVSTDPGAVGLGMNEAWPDANVYFDNLVVDVLK